MYATGSMYGESGVPRSASGRLAPTMDARSRIERLHREHYGSLVRSAFWIVGDMGLAEELVQEAYIRLAESIEQVDDPDRLRQYLHRIVVNLSRSRVRRLATGRRKLRAVAEQSRGDGASAGAGNLMEGEMAALLRNLPRRQRECVVLRFQADLTVPQIAQVLGLAEGSVKSHLHRALNRLRTDLNEGES